MTEYFGLTLAEIKRRRLRNPRRAYRVVDDFEAELADYCGAPFAIAVDSCTNALFLSLTYWRMVDDQEVRPRFPEYRAPRLTLPKRTYVGVLQAARNAGFRVDWKDWDWASSYRLAPTHVIDSARHFVRDVYTGGLMCLSFHAAKQLPLGRGGAILTDDEAAAEWLRAARMDGRPPGALIGATTFPGFHCPMPPDTAARGLWILSRWNDAGYDPPPLMPDDYPDLSLLDSSANRAVSNSGPSSPDVSSVSP